MGGKVRADFEEPAATCACVIDVNAAPFQVGQSDLVELLLEFCQRVRRSCPGSRLPTPLQLVPISSERWAPGSLPSCTLAK